jgi:hypothetical protein
LVGEIDPGFTHQELWVDVVKVPCEAFALQLLPEGSTFADVAAVGSGYVLLKSKIVKNLKVFGKKIVEINILFALKNV